VPRQRSRVSSRPTADIAATGLRAIHDARFALLASVQQSIAEVEKLLEKIAAFEHRTKPSETFRRRRQKLLEQLVLLRQTEREYQAELLEPPIPPSDSSPR